MGWHDLERTWLCISGFTGRREAGFLNLSTVDIWTRQVFPGEEPVHCRVCCSIPDLYPLDAVVTAPLNYDNQKCVQSLPDVLWGQPLNPRVENHWAGVRAELLCSLGLSFQERNAHHLGSSGGGGTEMSRWDGRPGDELTSIWVDTPITTVHSSILSLLPSNISPFLKKGIWSCVGDTHSRVTKE